MSLKGIAERCARLVLSLLLLATAFPLAIAQTQGPDVPSGFEPGNISVITGAGTGQTSGLSAVLSQFSATAMAVDAQGNIYMGTTTSVSNGSIVAVIYSGALPVPPILAAVEANPQAGSIYFPVVGGGLNTGPTAGEGNPATQTYFGNIIALDFDSAGDLYVVDSTNDVVRRVDHATTVVTTVAGQENVASSSTAIGDGGPATQATLSYPTDARIDADGNLYITDSGDNVVRVVYGGGVAPPILIQEGVSVSSSQTGYIYTVAGQVQVYCGGAGTCGNGTPATSANFGYVNSATVDSAGNLYLTDSGADVIRVVYAGVTPPAILSTVTSSPVAADIYTVAGSEFITCSAAPCGDGGVALSGTFNNPYWITVDAAGDIYVADNLDNTVRKVDYSGYVSDIAGVETPGQTPPIGLESGPATSVNFSGVPVFAFDTHDDLYVVDDDYVQGSHNLVWEALPLQPQTITFNSLSPVTYGVGSIQLSATASSGLPVTYSASGPATVSGSTLLVTGGGTITITASQAGNGTYAAAANLSQMLTVNKATLTITAEQASKIYDTPNPAFTALYSGFVSPDTKQAVFTGAPAFETTAVTDSNAGVYPLTVSQGSLTFTTPDYQADYTLVFVPSTLMITGATSQTISFPSLAPITYGATRTIALTASASSGLPVAYTISAGTAVSLSGSTLTVLGAGTVSITANQPGNNTYSAAAPVTQVLVIERAPLVVTAPDFSLTIGSAINPATFPAPIITGFVGSDTQASVTGAAHYNTTATSASPIGTYPVQVALGSLQLAPAIAADYTFAVFNPGLLSIVGIPQTISFNPLYNEVYGYTTSAAPPTAIASSGLPVTFTVAGPAYLFGNVNTTNPSAGSNSVTLESSGVGTVTITVTQAGNSQYAAATPVTQTIQITPAPLTVLANSVTREFGAENPVLTYQLGSNAPIDGMGGPFVNGDTDVPSVITGIPSITTTATSNSQPGTYPIVITTGTLAAPNYAFAFINGTLNILPAGSYTISADPASLTIPAGQSRQATLTINSVNLYEGTITLSCAQLPANVTCTFSPSTYTFTGSNTTNNGALPAQGTLTINTLGGETIVGLVTPPSSSIQRASLFLIPAGLGGLLLLLRRKQFARRNTAWQVCMALLAIGSLGLSSCGSSKSSTGAYAAPGTFNVIITGTGTTPAGSSVSSSMSLSVTVQ